jgi:lysophospholipase L1-like esterase
VPSFPLLYSFRPRLSLLALPGLIVFLAACASSAGSPAPTATPTSATTASSSEPKLAPPIPGAYAALGASETYGIGAAPHTDGYAYLVAHALHARHFVDVGIPGTTLSQGYDTELTQALAIRPALCTVFFGVNDLRAGVTRGAFLQDLTDLVATLRQAHAQVLIIGIPDLSKLPAVKAAHIGGLGEITSSWNAGMEEVAKHTGAHFLDLRRYDAELAAHPNYVAADGLHPSTIGHRRLAQVVVATVRQMGLWRTR